MKAAAFTPPYESLRSDFLRKYKATFGAGPSRVPPAGGHVVPPARAAPPARCGPSAHAVAGNGGTLNCAPSADAVAGNGRPLTWAPSADAVAGARRRGALGGRPPRLTKQPKHINRGAQRPLNHCANLSSRPKSPSMAQRPAVTSLAAGTRR